MDSSILANYKILEGVEQEDLSALWSSMTPVHLKLGSHVFKEGSEGTSLYFLLQGQVRISQQLTMIGSDMAAELMEKTLISLRGTDFPCFGEMGLLRFGKRSATVTATEDCELMELSRESFEKLVFERKNLGVYFLYNISRMVSARLQTANQNVLKLTTALSIALS